MYPRSSMMPHSSRGSAENSTRVPVRCPYCSKPLPAWAEASASAHGVWVKCKNPACRREVEIKL